MKSRYYFSPEETKRIKSLLATTDMSIEDIAKRMNCCKTSIVDINRKYQIRGYRGRRNSWTSNNAEHAL